MGHRAANGMGCLVSKGDGKPWLARWCYMGQIHTRSTGEVDRVKAQRKLEEFTRHCRGNDVDEAIAALERQIEKLKQKQKTKSGKLEFKDLWEKFSDKIWESDLSDSAQRSIQAAIKALERWCVLEREKGGLGFVYIRVEQFTTEHAEKFLKWIWNRVAVITYNQYLGYYRRIWHTLGKEYGFRTDVWDGFKLKPKATAHRRRALTDEEVAALFKVVENDPEMKTLFAIGRYTGQRLGDCCNLRWEQINWDNRTISFVPAKTRKKHSDPIFVPMMPQLEEILREREIGKIGFVSEKNAVGYQRTRLTHKINKIFEKAGIEICRKDEYGRRQIITGFHSLRHSYVSIISPEIGGLTTSRLVGHSSLGQTETYTDVMFNRVRERMENAFAGK